MRCRFRVDYALSREQKNKKGGKMYIQDKVEEYADEVFDLLDNGAHIYFCGLKGMMPGTSRCTYTTLHACMHDGRNFLTCLHLCNFPCLYA